MGLQFRGRIPDLQSEGRGFESHQIHSFASFSCGVRIVCKTIWTSSILVRCSLIYCLFGKKTTKYLGNSIKSNIWQTAETLFAEQTGLKIVCADIRSKAVKKHKSLICICVKRCDYINSSQYIRIWPISLKVTTLHFQCKNAQFDSGMGHYLFFSCYLLLIKGLLQNR